MEAILFVGIQATGKSTFFAERFFNTHIRINLDMLRTRHREDLLLAACISAKQPFVIDNTNVSSEQRAKYIALARPAGFRVVGYYFESKIHESLARNAVRPLEQQVPEKGVLGAYGRLIRPALSEGFDALYYVRMERNSGNEHTFIVEEWRDEI